MALDLGARRTGVAIGDELGMFAHPRAAIVGLAPKDLLEKVAALVEEEAITELIVGLPLTMAGGESAQTAEARSIAAALRERLPIPVTEVDERLSSQQAASIARGREARRSGLQDSLAAAVVLQAILDSRAGVAR